MAFDSVRVEGAELVFVLSVFVFVCLAIQLLTAQMLVSLIILSSVMIAIAGAAVVTLGGVSHSAREG